MERSAEFLRDGLRAIIKWHGGDATGCNPQLLLDRITDLLADAEAREAGEPTAAEVIEELHGCFDTIKHLSADIGTESGDIAVNGVALLGLAKIARWKEANHGK